MPYRLLLAAACNTGRTHSRVGRTRRQSTPFRLLLAVACNAGRTRSPVGRTRRQSTPCRLLWPRRATQAASAFARAAEVELK
eukprot:15827990-Heterocapsa_arctica.AAC.1